MKKQRQKMIASPMGRRIQARMAEMGIDFHDLARMADISHGTARAYGRRPDPHPTAELLRRVAGALKVTTDYLLHGDGEAETMVENQNPAAVEVVTVEALTELREKIRVVAAKLNGTSPDRVEVRIELR